MGADLYIRSITEKARDEFESLFASACRKRDKYIKAHPGSDIRKSGTFEFVDPKVKALQAKVDEYSAAMFPTKGYFRDSYNSSNLLWRMGLSWWRDVGGVLTNRKGEMSPTNAKKFKAMIEARPIQMEEVQNFLTENVGDFAEPPNAQEWFVYWSEDRERLLAFLQHAIDLNEAIDCSV